jgi:hypothetical protein
MKLQTCLRVGIPVQGLAFILAGLAFASMPARACTIFVLADTNRALFCNNEDWPNPNSRIWFVPAGDGYYGAVYVGFDNGFSQGGLNTEGLAYDWVGGYREKWESSPHSQTFRGNPSQRMLETCVTVNDAIAFFRSHDYPGFARAKMLVADRTGASAIIGARDGKLQVVPGKQCWGFGYGKQTIELEVVTSPQPTIANGFKILRDCRQPGPYATEYSNIYDLKTGDIFLFPYPGRDDEVKFNLAVELKKGGHYYDMPKIQEQLTQAPQPLLLNMERFPVDKFKPIPDQEPKVTAHLRAMAQDARNGTMQEDAFTTEAWKKALPMQKEIQANTKLLGDLVSLTLVDRGEVDGQRSYRYRAKFAKATLLVHYVFDGQNKLVSGATEAYEWKPGANMVKTPEAASPPVTGIGVMLRVDGKKIIVQEIVPDTPAASQKDIHAGDRILAVAQEHGPAVPVESAKLDQAVDLIHGPAGTIVYLTLVSAGEDDSHARGVRFVRAALKAPPY